MLYTVEVYKQDRRVANGLRFVKKIDLDCPTANPVEAERMAQQRMWEQDGKFKTGYIYTVHETYVTKRQLLTGEQYQERYDTPHYCSPSSETYWSA
jgi:hypothetical protein